MVEPLWSSLQHTINKYKNQMMYLRSQLQTSGLLVVANQGARAAFGRETPTGMPSANRMHEILQRRGSGEGNITTNKSADFGNYRTIGQSNRAGCTSRKIFEMKAPKIANQTWIDLPSAEIRSQAVEICRIIADYIDQFVVQGSLSEVATRAEAGLPISMQEVEQLTQAMVNDADPCDKAFMHAFVNTQMFN